MDNYKTQIEDIEYIWKNITIRTLYNTKGNIFKINDYHTIQIKLVKVSSYLF